MKGKKQGINRKQSNLDLFSGTYQYYANYRPGIPTKVIEIIINHFKIRPDDRILDIGCGTGQVALAMEGKCAEMVCLDSDPAMIEQAKNATKNSPINLVWIAKGSENLMDFHKKFGVFKVATICRAFHWMDQKQVLDDLDRLIDQNGGIAIFGDGSFWNGKEEWQQKIRHIVQKYLGEERRAGKGTFKKSDERWEDKISSSTFKYVTTRQVKVIRLWNIDSIIGYLFSTSFAAPNHFGDEIGMFKHDVRRTLLKINPKNVFEETAVFSIIMASREDRK